MGEKNEPKAEVLLVGYDHQENLGLRSILAYLRSQCHETVLLPFCPDHEELILSAVQHFNPRVVGFSLIFQYSLDDFGKLLRYLRANGVEAHFTAGGHFPSLRPEQTMELIPELDSIVRFEGELTLSELLDNLGEPRTWDGIRGLAFRRDGEIALTPLRPLVADLDSMPPIYRDEPQHASHGIKMAAMLASRGCLFNCSFCSIRQFYGSSQGPLRRVRSPGAVADEMLSLYRGKGVKYFSFQDDDFAARTPRQREWVREFLSELEKKGLASKIRWKISCRVDDLDQEILEMMIDHGLFAVYLGVESGNDTGLRALNKLVSVVQNHKAIDLLKYNNVALAMGFMLLDPSSTVESVRENIGFLRTVGADGYFPINFCKMLPYAGTPIEARLRSDGRLKGSPTRPGYCFADPLLDCYEFLVQKIFTRRNFSPDGLVAQLQKVDFDRRLDVSLGLGEPEGQTEALKLIIGRTNMLAVDTLEELLVRLVAHGVDSLMEESNFLVGVAEREWRGEMTAEIELKRRGMPADR